MSAKDGENASETGLNSEPSGERAAIEQGVESEIATILKTSERWAAYLRHKETRKRILYAVLCGAMVWAAFFVLIALQDDLNYSIVTLLSFLGNSLVSSAEFLVFPVSIVVAVLSFAVQTKIKSPLTQLEALVNSFHSVTSERSAVSALNLLEKMIRLLPEVKRMRYSEASLYGVIAFLLSLLITAKSGSFGMGISLLIGVLIWLYFRYEATIEYERELARFEKWQEKLEEQKREFIANL